jgi:hypothetical protein
MKRIAIFLGVVTVGAAAAWSLADAASDYQSQWQKREAGAKTPDLRVKLADDLDEAAKREGNKEYKAVLARKAYEMGRKDRRSYGSAAEALEVLQSTDPSTRMQCLVNFAELCDLAYNKDRAHLFALGMKLAEVKHEIGDQRLIETEVANQKSRMTVAAIREELKKAKRDYAEARSTAQTVLTAARNLAATGTPQRDQLLAFCDRNAPLLEKIAASSRRVDSVLKGLNTRQLVESINPKKEGDEPAAGDDAPKPREVAIATPKPDAEPAPKPEVKPEAKPEPKPQTPAKPEPEPEPAKPEPEPEPAVATKPDRPKGEPDGPISIFGRDFRVCKKCGEQFLNPFGEDKHLCSRCESGKNIFDLSNLK